LNFKASHFLIHFFALSFLTSTYSQNIHITHQQKAEIEGPEGTPYATKFYRLKLVLPSDYPNSPPRYAQFFIIHNEDVMNQSTFYSFILAFISNRRGFFLTKIYHPNVDMSSGAICVNTLKKDWNPSVTMSHVLSVIRCLLIVPFPESSLNDEAGKLFMESYEEYARRAKLMANVHGRPHSFCENVLSPPGSPTKNSKENENIDDIKRGQSLKSSSISSSNAVLKQSNVVEIHINDVKKSITKSAIGKNVDKKSKKKSLKRL